ncbi:hypothetical protein F0562_008901 [Nyssa sinensis]|uniref:B3 domain-containing protein n=1 Tax=Nyssa sinensis TaxID=561372 RepID=A0A5J5A8P3_9ASTE|nr:hypothetical protein F0562_008901 [Nyssa sinensis]
MKELTLEDVENIEVDPHWNLLDILCVVVEVTAMKLEEESKIEKKTHKTKESSSNKLTLTHQWPLDIPKKMKKRFTGALDISKGERLMTEQSSMNKKPVDEYPVDMSREERLRRERLLKKPIVENQIDMSSLMREKLFKKSFMGNRSSSKNVCQKRMFCERKDREQEARSEMQKKIKMINNSLNDQPSDMPMEFKKRIQEMGGDDVKLVMQKALYMSDVTPGLNRLSMPLTQIKEKFLIDEEMKIMESRSGKKLASIEVPVIGPSLDEYKLSFKKWDMRKEKGNASSMYVLIKEWSSVVVNNSLEAECDGGALN